MLRFFPIYMRKRKRDRDIECVCWYYLHKSVSFAFTILDVELIESFDDVIPNYINIFLLKGRESIYRFVSPLTYERLEIVEQLYRENILYLIKIQIIKNSI